MSVLFLKIYSCQPTQLTLTLKPPLSPSPNQSRLWSVLRIVMETEIVSQEFVTVFQDFWGLTALEVNTHAHTRMHKHCATHRE